MCSLYNFSVVSYSKFIQNTYVAFTKHIHLICRTYITLVLLAPQALPRVAPKTMTNEAIPTKPGDLPGMNNSAQLRSVLEMYCNLYDMFRSRSLYNRDISDVTTCSVRAVIRVRANNRANGGSDGNQ